MLTRDARVPDCRPLPEASYLIKTILCLPDATQFYESQSFIVPGGLEVRVYSQRDIIEVDRLMIFSLLITRIPLIFQRVGIPMEILQIDVRRYAGEIG
jgi:hypothetical protein